jgi:leader peptidase (prepilin peptidase)/N-methyltransferase
MAALMFGFNLTLIFVLIFIWLLICLCAIDFQHQLLPDSLTLSLLWVGLIANTQSLFTTLPNAVLSAAGAYAALWLFIKLFYLLTGKIGMGNGDFKLFAAFGAWLGWTQLPMILLISSISGSIIGMIYLKSTHQTKETPIPFGPFLCLAGLISLFFGKAIVKWYLGFYF